MTDKKTSPLKKALCEFKQLKVKITKGKENPFFKAKYADLPEILGAIEGELAELGVIVISKSLLLDGKWVLRTFISHTDGEEEEESFFPLFGSKPQEFGSSITYARRYNIQSLLNLAAEDDDGNSANKAAPMKQPAKPARDPYKESAAWLNDVVVKELGEITDIDGLNRWSVNNKAKIDFLVKFDDLGQKYSKVYSETFGGIQS